MNQTKMKMSDILNAAPGLRKLSDRDVKPATGYAMAKLLKKLGDEITLFEAARLKLYKDNGVEKDGQYVLETAEAKETVGNGVKELLDVEVDIEFRPIKLSGFIGAVSSGELLVADAFIENDLGE